MNFYHINGLKDTPFYRGLSTIKETWSAPTFTAITGFPNHYIVWGIGTRKSEDFTKILQNKQLLAAILRYNLVIIPHAGLPAP
jgi:hypothetical protein